MANYIQQPNISMPNSRGQDIHHYVESFWDPDSANLDIDVNAFLQSLIALPSVPIIQNISFSSSFDGTETIFSTQVHYILVE